MPLKYFIGWFIHFQKIPKNAPNAPKNAPNAPKWF